MNLLTVDSKLKDLVNAFVEKWDEGERRSFTVGFESLGFDHEPTEGELEEIGNDISYIASIEVVEDGMLLIEMDKDELKARYDTQLQEWIEESDLKQFGRYESCGWI
ncbi:hypothetical protein [Turicibacter sanguinis]|uniref:hypothetical protein n=1 Tax=Turicibacter sanguinis TaxID=154288 RepID=UPI0018ABEDDE|nr:hypothetical protein [Turicibacter sanguinis]MDB8554074.1 hypothetical protein [Turicibacter sanguinis]